MDPDKRSATVPYSAKPLHMRGDDRKATGHTRVWVPPEGSLNLDLLLGPLRPKWLGGFSMPEQSLTPQLRFMRARIAAHAQHAQGKTNTGPARAAFEQKFLDEVDPERRLSEAERRKRASHARKLHFQRLAFASVKARAKKTSQG